MACNQCGSTSDTSKCACKLTLKTDETFIVPYLGSQPLAPVDLTDVVEASETNTRLRLDAQDLALVYSNEKSLSGDFSEDTIPLETLSKLIPLSGLKDVSYNGVSGGDLLVFNIQTQVWEPISVNDDDLVSVIGYNSAGRLAKADSAGGGGGGGGAAERPTYSTATAESVVPDPTIYGQYSYTALATNLVIGSPGVASDGKTLVFRFRDNGTARTLSWHQSYRGIGVTIPGNTTGGFVYVGAKYNAQDNKWDVLAVNRQG